MLENVTCRPVEQLIQQHAAATPHAPAVDAADRRITYAELANESAQVAAALRSRELPPESLVALHLSGGADLVIAMIGILRAGLAFMPVNIEAPAQRRADLLRRAAPR